jgi:transcriptional regulator with XRE-family HTH domain
MLTRMRKAAADPEVDEARRLLGRRIQALRKLDGRTQEQLAEALDLTGQSISEIENGHEAPRFATLVKIARELGEPLESFFAFDTLGPRDKEHQRAVRDLLRLLRDQPPEVVRTLTQQAKPLIALVGRASERG